MVLPQVKCAADGEEAQGLSGPNWAAMQKVSDVIASQRVA